MDLTTYNLSNTTCTNSLNNVCCLTNTQNRFYFVYDITFRTD